MAKNQPRAGIAARQVRVIRLYREVVARGFREPVTEIARRLKVSSATVQNDLTLLWPQWKKEAVSEVQAIVDAVNAQVDWVQAQARLAWTASRNKQITETVRKMHRGQVKEVVERTQTGDPRYLSVILAAEDLRIRLTVGYKPTKVETTTIDLSLLTDDQLARLERGEPPAQVLREPTVIEMKQTEASNGGSTEWKH